MLLLYFIKSWRSQLGPGGHGYQASCTILVALPRSVEDGAAVTLPTPALPRYPVRFARLLRLFPIGFPLSFLSVGIQWDQRCLRGFADFEVVNGALRREARVFWGYDGL